MYRELCAGHMEEERPRAGSLQHERKVDAISTPYTIADLEMDEIRAELGEAVISKLNIIECTGGS